MWIFFSFDSHPIFNFILRDFGSDYRTNHDFFFIGSGWRVETKMRRERMDGQDQLMRRIDPWHVEDNQSGMRQLAINGRPRNSSMEEDESINDAVD